MLKGICQVSFIKVKDGSDRVIYCTLSLNYIPVKYESSINKIVSGKFEDPDIVPMWDVVENKWKSFRLSKMNFFLTSDELVKENKTGHNTISKNADILKERKEEAQKEFQERVQYLKEKAKEASKNINGGI